MKKITETSIIKFRTVAAPVLITLLCFITTSCRKFLEVGPPADQVISAVVFEDDKTATSAVTGLYSEMMNRAMYFMQGGITLYPGMSADELTYTGTNTSISAFSVNLIPSDNSIITTSLWQFAYAHIYQANSILEGLDKSTLITDGVKKQLKGEMLFVRAFCYFNLVNIYGDVPLVLTTDYRVNAAMGRTSADVIYAQVISDLNSSKSLLGKTSPTGTASRPNLWAPAAMLSRVYLYRKDWANAGRMADSVITKSGLQLETSLDNIYLNTSKEAIWQLAPVQPANASEGGIFIPVTATAKPTYVITAGLLAAFEAGDKRKTSWTAQRTVSGVTYTYPYKYKVRIATAKTEYNTVLRLAEQYLIRAEAKAMQNDLAGAVADVDIIRQKHGGFTGILAVPASQAATIDLILKERRIEYFAEWGHRWFDLKRTGKVDAVIGGQKPSWKSTAALYPIPFSQLQRNPNLTPNPGY